MLTNHLLAINLGSVYQPGNAAVSGGATITLSTLVNPLIANVLIISGVVAFFVIFLAGFNYITAGGDKGKTEQAQQMLNYGVLGIIVVAVAYLITNLIGTQLGIKLL
jgi:hypothetical protein